MKDNDKTIQEKFLHLSDEDYNTASGWRRLKTRMGRSSKKTIPASLIGIAAGVIAIIVSAYFLLNRKPDPLPETYAYQPHSAAIPDIKKTGASQKTNAQRLATNNKPSEKGNNTTRFARIQKQARNLPSEKKQESNNKAANAGALQQTVIMPAQPVVAPIRETPKETIASAAPAIITISAEKADQLMAETIGKIPKNKRAVVRLSLRAPESNNGIEKSSSSTTLINF